MRYYDAALGRFISADTIVPDPNDPQTFNRYAYVLNNPLRYTDPTGSFSESFWDIVIGIADLIGGLFSAPPVPEPVSLATPGMPFVGPIQNQASSNFYRPQITQDFQAQRLGFSISPLANDPFSFGGGNLSIANVVGSEGNFGLTAGRVFSDFNPVFLLAKSVAGLVNGNDSFTKEPFSISPSSIAIGIGGTISKVPLLGQVGSPNAGGFIRSFVTEHDQIFFRVFSGNDKIGGFLTAVRPKNAAFARESLALPTGNKADFIQEVLVPEGTRLQRSRALPLYGKPGGAEQFQIIDQNRIPKGNFGPGVPFQ